MAEFVVIRLGHEPHERVEWIVVDDEGTRRGPPSAGTLAEASAGVQGRPVIVLVPATEALTTVVDLPIRGGAKLLAALPYALEEHVANDVETLHFAATIHMGGAAPVASLQAAATAVIAGIASYVLIPAGWNGYSGARARQTVAADAASMPGGEIARDYYLPHGLTAPPQWYSLMARRHMHEYGTRPEQLGAIAVAMRKHAQLNPRAVMHGRPLSLEDYLASPMLADPYRLFDCCLETDGAAAAIVTTAERARDLGKKPIYIMATASGQPYPADEITNRKDIFETGLTIAAPEASGRAGIGACLLYTSDAADELR